VAASQLPSRWRGSLSPTSPSAIAHIFAKWALINFLLFFSPFVIGTLLLYLSPSIVHNTLNVNDLALGLPLIAFYAATYAVFLGKSHLLRFSSIG
jgi:hypothetical protein